EKTPIVDGTGLKTTLEYRIAPYIDQNIGDYIKEKKAFIALGVDRWGMTRSFLDNGYECIFGDFMFGLGIPLAVRSEDALKKLAALSLPIVTRLPFEWIYPTGEKQEQRVPKYEKYYQWGAVIAGDCHYIKRHMPDNMIGKVIATNTTTPEDVELFRSLGVKYLLTTTPVLDGRSFGTNMMEAALIAVSGKKRVLTDKELDLMLDELEFQPQLQELN
ncbi:MAG: quinate 5-dehydrogenase, partial [Chloroflexi bacterium]|nr:quinate 5-dehydrogenase [Chloroflexota bacterium]